MLKQEGGVDEGTVLGWGLEGKPDFLKAVGVSQESIAGDVAVVILDVAGVPGRLVGENSSDYEQQAGEPAFVPQGTDCCGRRSWANHGTPALKWSGVETLTEETWKSK